VRIVRFVAQAPELAVGATLTAAPFTCTAANAVYHATRRRFRSLPITIDHLL